MSCIDMRGHAAHDVAARFDPFGPSQELNLKKGNGMHDNLELILTLTCGLCGALVFGYLTQRLGLSPIVGYLLAGFAIGPHSPGFVADPQIAEQIADVGVILLLFGVGLHFRVEDLLSIRRVALPGAVLQTLATAGLGALAAHAFGWTSSAAIAFGLSVSVASTVVLTRVLGDLKVLHTRFGHVAVGWLVAQDLLAVFALILLPSLVGGDAASAGHLATMAAVAALKIAALAGIVLVIGGRVLPWLLNHVAGAQSRELFTLAVLAIALSHAVGAALLFGTSMALGAFLAGMVVGRSDFSLRAAIEALPMRDAFAVLFFVSVGMLFDAGFLLRAPGLAAGTLAVVMIGTPLITCALALALGLSFPSAVRLGLALGQIGEFSFILARLGVRLDALPEDALDAVVVAAIASIALNPFLIRLAGPLDRVLGSWFRNRSLAALPEAAPAPGPGDAETIRAVVIGYGPVGQTLTRLLQENKIEPTIVEMNLETVHRLRAMGVPAIYGDANRRQTLEQANIAQARGLLLSASGLTAAKEIVRVARDINPKIRIMARSTYLRERTELHLMGADEVYAGEGEVALAMTESLLRRLGATPDQIDRERQRVRADLFGEARHGDPQHDETRQSKAA